VPRALVTGATAGLGAEFAHQLADRGYDLVLVARDATRLRAMAASLPGVDVEALPADLTTDIGCRKTAERLERPDIDLLVNNAGMGAYAAFGTADLSVEESQLDLNVRAVLRLTHAAVRSMTGRGSGRILNVSSVAGFVPRAGNASYAASKAWVTLFSEGLALQLADSGVSVTVVCPGFTHTEFHQRAHADMSHVPERMWLDAPGVVRAALEDTFAGRTVSVPSLRYKVMATASRVLPRPMVRSVMKRRGL
jgi:short-subunit dehydrogenase